MPVFIFATKRIFKLILQFSLWLVLWYGLGVVLFRYLNARVEEAPGWIEWTVRFALETLGYGDVQEPETIGAFCELVALVLCWIFVAMVLLIGYRLIARFIHSG
ncbi:MULTISPECIES: hypothetical protein [unclassified Caballeronia]|uniref:hypothetical protein n=1 Tax=unclassified Caballeronia TaxID=2646786 RepID=UPI002863B081|nr:MULTISPECIES: hypothetical protein [unclassified Caballeronia]MDR5824262.1 hypothetical protein [Caballeronia sp. LZ043]MDR5882157.1 hypothetical protein [Caballeronia sp. LZ032]